MSRVNWPIVALGVLWWWMETSYFGHNDRPGSVAELFADGMALAFYAAFAFPPRKSNITIEVRR
ncbi:hypothetical protein V8017_16155 [Stenotrophomonas rhizophila]